MIADNLHSGAYTHFWQLIRNFMLKNLHYIINFIDIYKSS